VSLPHAWAPLPILPHPSLPPRRNSARGQGESVVEKPTAAATERLILCPAPIVRTMLAKTRTQTRRVKEGPVVEIADHADPEQVRVKPPLVEFRNSWKSINSNRCDTNSWVRAIRSIRASQ
jgi:hypothetical protein